jgi:putative transposase
VKFYLEHREEGYRRISYMMLAANIVAVSPASVYRVLKSAGLMRAWARKPSKRGTGFVQPEGIHQHWHLDIAYINVGGTFFFLCTILDGYSRFIVNWDLRAHMTQAEVEIILQRAREQFPDARPRIISDNGPQFIARDFKEFIRLCAMTHVRTSPFYPQSNGKIERYHRSIKSECIRPGVPLNLADAQRLISNYVDHYNRVRLHSAIGYIAPADKFSGRAAAIIADRKAKLANARISRLQNLSACSL